MKTPTTQNNISCTSMAIAASKNVAFQKAGKC